jgi:hypothetical protein
MLIIKGEFILSVLSAHCILFTALYYHVYDECSLANFTFFYPRYCILGGRVAYSCYTCCNGVRCAARQNRSSCRVWCVT